MKIILNPKYEHLRSYLTHLEEHFEREGKEIFRDRNILRTLQVGDLTLCVKKYALPSLSARVAQRIYKSSKGKKAYFHPLNCANGDLRVPSLWPLCATTRGCSAPTLISSASIPTTDTICSMR